MSFPGTSEETAAARIPYSRQSIDEADIQEVVDVLKSDYVTQGPRLAWFEDGLREATGAEHAVAVSSGTAALHLTCLAMDLQKDDVGIVPAITFAATANCLRYAGADPVFCDVDSASALSSLAHFQEAYERAASEGLSAKACLPVSFSGRVSDLAGIAQWAMDKEMRVIEDAAHSLGAYYEDQDGSRYRSGSCQHSDAAIVSFHPVKPICSAEGGAVLTNDALLAKRTRALRSHGMGTQPSSAEPWLSEQAQLGYNYRMTELQAALGKSQLKKLDDFRQRRSALAARYGDAFSSSPFCDSLETPEQSRDSAWHLYVIRFRKEGARQEAYSFLKSRGIDVQVHYAPVYRHPYYAKKKHGNLPGAEAFYASCLSLPLYPSMQEADQDRVIAELEAFCR